MGAELDAGARLRAIDALAAGASVTEVARRSGYSRKHIYRLLDDPRFVAELSKKKEQLAAEPVQGDERLALDILRKIATSGEEESNRVKAAKVLLDHATLGKKAAKPGPQSQGPASPVMKIHEGRADGAKAASEWLEKQA